MRGQLSLEFAIVFFGILLISLVSITNFLDNNLTKESLDYDKIASSARAAILLLNSGYLNYSGDTINYLGYYVINDSIIEVYITPNISSVYKNFIVSYIKDTTQLSKNYSIVIKGI